MYASLMFLLSVFSCCVASGETLHFGPGAPKVTWELVPCVVGLGLNCSFGGTSCIANSPPFGGFFFPLAFTSINANVAGNASIIAIGTRGINLCNSSFIRPSRGAWGTVLISDDESTTWRLVANDTRLGAMNAAVVTHRMNATDINGQWLYKEAVCVIGGREPVGNASDEHILQRVTCAWADTLSEWISQEILPETVYGAAVASYRGRLIVVGGWRKDVTHYPIYASAACQAYPCAIAHNWTVILEKPPFGARMHSAMISSIALGSWWRAPPDNTLRNKPTVLVLASGVDPINPDLVAQDLWVATDVNAQSWRKTAQNIPVSLNVDNKLALDLVDMPKYNTTVSKQRTLLLPSVIAILENAVYQISVGGYISGPVGVTDVWTPTPSTNSFPSTTIGMPGTSVVSYLDSKAVPTTMLFSWDTREPSAMYSIDCADCGDGFYTQGCQYKPYAPACVKCSTCRPGTYTVTNCSYDADTWCYRCTVCDIGQYVATNCSLYADTVCNFCSTCVPGKSWMVSACTNYTNTVCSLCTVCGPGYRVGSPCTLTNDTVCVPDEPFVSLSISDVAKETYYSVCALIGLSTVAIAVYVYVTTRRNSSSAYAVEASAALLEVEQPKQLKKSHKTTLNPGSEKLGVEPKLVVLDSNAATGPVLRSWRRNVPSAPSTMAQQKSEYHETPNPCMHAVRILCYGFTWIFYISVLFLLVIQYVVLPEAFPAGDYVLVLLCFWCTSPIFRVAITLAVFRCRTSQAATLSQQSAAVNASPLMDWVYLSVAAVHFRLVNFMVSQARTSGFIALAVLETLCIDIPMTVILFLTFNGNWQFTEQVHDATVLRVLGAVCASLFINALITCSQLFICGFVRQSTERVMKLVSPLPLASTGEPRVLRHHPATPPEDEHTTSESERVLVFTNDKSSGSATPQASASAVAPSAVHYFGDGSDTSVPGLVASDGDVNFT